MDYTTKSCREFVTVLASSEPAPGGGGASALVAALGTALGNMVGSLTVGKKKYADMNAEEQHVVDSFQGREHYEYVMSHADYYLDTGAHQPLTLASGMEG